MQADQGGTDLATDLTSSAFGNFIMSLVSLSFGIFEKIVRLLTVFLGVTPLTLVNRYHIVVKFQGTRVSNV